jgi:hypothetical protein
MIVGSLGPVRNGRIPGRVTGAPTGHQEDRGPERTSDVATCAQAAKSAREPDLAPVASKDYIACVRDVRMRC